MNRVSAPEPRSSSGTPESVPGRPVVALRPWLVAFVAMVVTGLVGAGASCSPDEGYAPLDGGPSNTTSGGGICVGPTCPAECAKNPVPGCACSVEGQDLLCGVVDSTYPDGTHVCGKGVSVCAGGVWGACVINQAVTLVPDTPPGFYTEGLGTGSQCINNPCDPACIDFTDNGGGLTDAGITGTDAGITLTGDGGNVCVPKTCAGAGANCGPVSDTCGGLLNCGTCPMGQSCGGGGPNLCGFGTACTGLCAQQMVCSGTATTSVSGTVYEANGVIPVPNAVVYVPLAPLTPFSAGVECDSAATCLAGSGNPLVTTTTAFDGTFTLSNMPVGTNIPLVMQVGRFRREVTIPNVAACVNTNLAAINGAGCQANGTTCSTAGQCCSNSCSLSNGSNPICDPLTRLPKNKGEGDIPKMAFVTGAVDSLECVWRMVGIDDSEFTGPGGTGRINLFTGHFAAGSYASPATSTPDEVTLVSSPSTLSNYDIVLFPCQGQALQYYTGGLQAQYEGNIANYVNGGGRVFTTHYSYIWLISDSAWTSCTPNGTACTSSGACCSGDCSGGVCVTNGCLPNGAAATSAGSCCSNLLTGGVCAAPVCIATGTTCSTNASCCTGSCSGSPKKCVVNGTTNCSATHAACSSNANCCGGSCTGGLCCLPSATACSSNSQCCTGACASNGTTNVCCLPESAVCTNNADCCNGSCAPNGRCMIYESPLSAAMVWDVDQTAPSPDPGTGLISQSFAKGVELSQWLQLVGASTTFGQISINTLRNDFSAVVAPTELWMTTSGVPMEATFNTPINAATTAQCGRVVHSDFHVLSASNNGNIPFPQECPSVATPTPTCSAVGAACTQSTNCCSESCSGGVCVAVTCAAKGASCTTAAQCCSATCTGGVCAANACMGLSATGCTTAAQCCTNKCTAGVCVANGTTCTPNNTCATSATCCSTETCNGGVCCKAVGISCSSNSQCCGGYCNGGTCTTPLSGACSASTQCKSGNCTNGVCCTTPGSSCAQNSDCCGGSCAGNACCLNQGGACTSNGQCCSNNCTNGICSVMNPQELLLANMLFDLASCITPDVAPPCVPVSCNAQGLDCGMAGDGCGNQIACGNCTLPTTCGGGGVAGVCGTPLIFTPANFIRDYDASLICPAGTGPVWRDFSYVAITPGDSKISFTIQTATSLALLPSAPLETLVFSAVPGPPTMALLNQPVVASTALASDTGSTSPDYTLQINKQIQNNYYLRVTATLTPSSNMLQAPTLSSWDMLIDCAANQ